MSVIAGAVVGGILGAVVGGVVGAVSGREQKKGRVAALAFLGAVLVSAVSPQVTPRVVDWWSTLTTTTAFGKYQLRAVKLMGQDPAFKEWQEKLGQREQAFAAGSELGAKGVMRLPDAEIVRVSALYGRMLAAVTDDECVRIFEGKAAPAEHEKFFGALEDGEITALAEITTLAMSSELRGSPAAVTPSDPSIDAAVQALVAVDAKGVEENVAPTAKPDAPPGAKCRMLRFVYQKLDAIPQQHRATLARAARM